jgi:hypothetical protein
VGDEIGDVPPLTPGGRGPLVIVERGEKVLEATALADCWCELAVGGSVDGDDRWTVVAGDEVHGSTITTSPSEES